MIKGIGIDLCDIERMKKAAARAGFIERLFSKNEIAYAGDRADAALHYAAAFAAKEALAKAGGWGLGKMGLDACEVIRTEKGPIFNFSADFQSRLDEEGINQVFLSISHESGMAAAMVVLEG
ncbi:holo-ACP synthase [Cloacibacillus evryensis]|uniref:holo-ACP synthase n=1 Tax=Cloacibacillus evryensis TaxID=508460 RepID=UPI00210BF3CB|nr:holo-ACP synthase [Cloacibacillus evryensis]MCQ4763447.1 holo-ACP synthase [Cloacibacillus evryensis]